MISFDARQLGPFVDWLRGSLRDGARRGSLLAANRLVSIITTEIIPGEKPPPVDEGVYRAAWRAEPTEDGAAVVNTAPYASIIEYGVRAENVKVGRAMIDALTKWVLRKQLVGKPARTPTGKADQLAQARAMAWAIAKSMEKRGIFNRDHQGLRIGEKALARNRAKLVGEVASEIVKALKGGG